MTNLLDQIKADREAGTPEWLSGMEMHILREMCEGYQPFGDTETYYGLSAFAHSGVTKDMARGILRAMTDRGLCQYKAGLFSEDGEPRGAGYAATEAGLDMYQKLSRRPDSATALLAAGELADAVDGYDPDCQDACAALYFALAAFRSAIEVKPRQISSR